MRPKNQKFRKDNEYLLTRTLIKATKVKPEPLSEITMTHQFQSSLKDMSNLT